MKYTIGIIDEKHEQVLDVERTIIINKPETVDEDDIQFEEYILPEGIEDFQGKLPTKVLEDIEARIIQTLIVDYQIVLPSGITDGTSVFKVIAERVPKFPIVLLTNLPDDCYQKDYIDVDKVYAKENFLKVDNSYSKEKVQNLFQNMDHYIKLRSSVEMKLEETLKMFDQMGYESQTYNKLIKLEEQLSDYTPVEDKTIRKALNAESLQEMVSSIMEVNRLLGTDE